MGLSIFPGIAEGRGYVLKDADWRNAVAASGSKSFTSCESDHLEDGAKKLKDSL